MWADCSARFNYRHLATAFLIGSLILFGIATGVRADNTNRTVLIPGDHPLPTAGQRITVPIKPGTEIRFGSELNLEDVFVEMQGSDLLVHFAKGGELLLQNFFAALNPPATVAYQKNVPISAETFRSAATGGMTKLKKIAIFSNALSNVEAAAGGPVAAGGGELFGLLKVASWLIERIDLVSKAEAAPRDGNDASASSLQFAQLEAQMQIYLEGALLKEAQNYEAVTATIQENVAATVNRGASSKVDLDVAKGFLLEARLEVKDAAFRRLVAIDAHQDRFGKRLEKAAAPVWPAPPSDQLSVLTAKIAAAKHATVRQNWRRISYAKDTIKLLESLTVLTQEIARAFRDQYSLGRRTVNELISSEKALYQARVQLLHRNVAKLRAEAWLLSAMGSLPPDVIKQPGWQ